MSQNLNDPSQQSLTDTFHQTTESMDAAAANTEDMMNAMEEKGTQRYAAARAKLREHWAVAKDDLGQLKQKAVGYSQTAAKATNTFAHDHPWTTAGAAVGVGALIGWLVTRRSPDQPRS